MCKGTTTRTFAVFCELRSLFMYVSAQIFHPDDFHFIFTSWRWCSLALSRSSRSPVVHMRQFVDVTAFVLRHQSDASNMPSTYNNGRYMNTSMSWDVSSNNNTYYLELEIYVHSQTSNIKRGKQTRELCVRISSSPLSCRIHNIMISIRLHMSLGDCTWNSWKPEICVRVSACATRPDVGYHLAGDAYIFLPI